MKRTNDFQTIRSEGGLLPHDLLRRVLDPKAKLDGIRYPGNAIHVSEYVDTEDFSGSLRKVFDDSLAFVMRNLHKVQAARDGCLFTATVHRTATARSVESSVESSGKTRDQILDLLASRADLTIVQVAQALGLSPWVVLTQRFSPSNSGMWITSRIQTASFV